MFDVLVLEVLDVSLIAYVFSILFGIASILYFAKDILLSLSVTIKTSLLFYFCVSLLVFSNLISSDSSNLVFLTLSGISYLVGTKYWFEKSLDNTNKRFLFLAFSSVLFLILGLTAEGGALFNLIDDIVPDLVAFVSLTAVFLVFIALDILEKDKVKYDFNFRETVGKQSATLGTIQITNESKFTREINRHSLKVSIKVGESKSYGVPIERAGSVPNSLGSKESVDIEYEIPIQKIRNIVEDSDDLTGYKYEVDIDNRGKEFTLYDEERQLNVRLTPT